MLWILYLNERKFDQDFALSTFFLIINHIPFHRLVAILFFVNIVKISYLFNYIFWKTLFGHASLCEIWYIFIDFLC